MTRDEFWRAIESISSWKLWREDENALQPLRLLLAGCTEEGLESFEEHLAAVLFAIDGEPWFEATGVGSGDGFLYCRCYVVARGFRYWDRIRRNPTKMKERWFEPLLSVAREEWGRRHNQPPEVWPFFPELSYETGANTARWPQAVPKTLSEEEEAQQFELNYQRAMSRVVHWHRQRRYSSIIKALEPYADRLSPKMTRILDEARTAIGRSTDSD